MCATNASPKTRGRRTSPFRALPRSNRISSAKHRNVQPKPSVSGTLLRALSLLRANPVIIVPSILLGIASAAIATVLSEHGFLSWAFFSDMNVQGPDAFWLFFGTIVAMALRILAAVAAIAFTTGMAAAAWRQGSAHVSDGAAAFRRNGVQAFVALVLLTLV